MRTIGSSADRKMPMLFFLAFEALIAAQAVQACRRVGRLLRRFENFGGFGYRVFTGFVHEGDGGCVPSSCLLRRENSKRKRSKRSKFVILTHRTINTPGITHPRRPLLLASARSFHFSVIHLFLFSLPLP